ncbi:MAG: hypothetical protein ACW97X_13480, partial [Candidatus Hodarchaeales archaeon]
MNSEIENLSRKHGLMLLNDDPEFLHCCMKCEVATSIGSVDSCPQRVHTSNSCCPSCGVFLEHGLDTMLAHWKDRAQFFAGFQIVVPLKISEEVIRSAFRLHKVPVNQLRLLYEWNNRTLDIVFTKHISWVITIQLAPWPLDTFDTFLRDPLVFGLAGFSARAGAAAFSQLRGLFEDLKTWLIENYQIDPEEIFIDGQNDKHDNIISYYVSYFLRVEDIANMAVDILAPDYEKSSQPERCLIRTESSSQIPIVTFQNVNEALIMQKGLITSWQEINPSLQKMLDELSDITTEMRSVTTIETDNVMQLSELLDRTQLIQAQFLKLKPIISNMQGHLSPVVPLLAIPLIKQLLPSFNLNLMNSWLDFARSVERSVEGASTYISGK